MKFEYFIFKLINEKNCICYRPTIIVTSSGKDLDPSLTFAEADDNVNKNIIGGGDRSSSGHNPSSLSGPHATRKRATVDPNKTTCMLYLQADHLFYKKYGSEEACIEVMTRHVQRVNAIYKATGEFQFKLIMTILENIPPPDILK